MYFQTLMIVILAGDICFASVSSKALGDNTNVGALLRQKRVISGETAEIGEFPFIAAVEYRWIEHDLVFSACAGAILNELYIVTAAHCILDPAKFTDLKIRVGTASRLRGGETHEVEGLPIFHDGYNPKNEKKYDIALLKLKTKIVPRIKVKEFISLYDKQVSEGMPATFAGWGKVKSGDRDMSDQLRSYSPRIINTAYCDRLNDGIPPGTICAATRVRDATTGTADGDSGGPLIIDDKLAGILSGGSDGKFPDIFTEIWHYKDWIEENSKLEQPEPTIVLIDNVDRELLNVEYNKYL